MKPSGSKRNVLRSPERGGNLRNQRSGRIFPSTLAARERESSWERRMIPPSVVLRSRSSPAARERSRSRSFERRSRSESETQNRRGSRSRVRLRRRRGSRSRGRPRRSVIEQYRQSGRDSAEAYYRRRSLRASSSTISDWLRSATFRDQERADFRHLQREDSQHRRLDARISPPGSYESMLTVMHRSITATAQEPKQEEEDEGSEAEDAVGLRYAGDASQGLDRHRCELPPDKTQTPFPRLPPHPSFAQRFQRKLLPYIMLDLLHPYTRRIMHSMAIVHSEQTRHAHSRHWYMIHPFSKARTYWEPLVAFLIAVSLVLIPVYLAFFNDTKRESPENIVEASLSMFRCLVSISVICLVDCMLNFFTGYYVAHESTTVLTPRLVARRYLRSYFLIDFLPALPTEVLGKIAPKEQTWNMMVCMEFLRLARMRVLFLYTRRSLDVLGLRSSAFGIARATLILAIFMQWMSLAHWFVPPAVYGRDLPESTPGNMTWSVVNDLWNASMGLKYAHCLLRCAVLSLRFGVPLSPPHTPVDYTLFIFNAIIGAVLYASLCIWMIMLGTGMDSLYIRYGQIMVLMKEYAGRNRLTPDLKKKMFRYYDYMLDGKFFRSDMIEKSLSRHLLNQVHQHTYREGIRSSGLFWGLPIGVCTTLVRYMKPKVLMRGHVLMRVGDKVEAMYFVHSGALALITAKGVEIEHVQDGDYFGEIEMLYPRMKCKTTATVLEPTVLLVLERQHFRTLFHSYLPLLFRLQQRAQLRLKRLRAAEAYSPPPGKVVQEPPPPKFRLSDFLML